jgi:hypothetical protein
VAFGSADSSVSHRNLVNVGSELLFMPDSYENRRNAKRVSQIRSGSVNLLVALSPDSTSHKFLPEEHQESADYERGVKQLGLPDIPLPPDHV